MTTAPELLAVIGPTASGKSSVTLEIAARREDGAQARVEIVAVDAFTIYRGLDIATAKPTPQQREQVPHHLVDVLDPDQEVSVAWFQSVARVAIQDILARGRTPLLVGGSGLYFRAVVDDLRFPPTDPEVRAAVEARWTHDPVAAHAHLTTLDPAAAAKIEPENLRRTVRALEVIELSGERFSAFAAAWEQRTSIHPGLRVAYLEPETAILRQRVRDRAEAMVAAGLVDEAAALRERWSGLSRTAAHAIGYTEAFRVLDGELAPGELADAIATRTWHYARRQRAWFRRDPRCTPRAAEAIVAAFAVSE